MKDIELKETKPLIMKQAAVFFRVSRKTLKRLCVRGCYGACKVKGRWVFKEPPFTEQAIGLAAIAEALDVSIRWVQKLCTSRRVQAFRIGRQWRVPLREATKLMLLRLGGFKDE